MSDEREEIPIKIKEFLKEKTIIPQSHNLNFIHLFRERKKKQNKNDKNI